MKDKRNLQLRRPYQTTDKGFTLIEVLVAVFIASIVLTILYASFFQIIRAKERVEQELELYHESRVVMSKMTKDIATAFERGNVTSESRDTSFQYFEGSKNGDFSTLTFTSLSRTPTPDARESDQTEISYFVEPLPDSELFALMRRDNPRMGTETGGTQFALSERIVGFTLTYIGSSELDLGTDDITVEWDSNNTLSLPDAVNINLIMRSPRGEDIEFNALVVIPVMDGN